MYPTTARPTVRVLIIDDEESVRTQLMNDVLPRDEYIVQAAQGVGDLLVQDALRLAKVFRPHVAIVDLHLLDEHSDERSGLKLLKRLHSAQCILYSGYLSPEVIREAIKKYNVKDCISKAESPRRLLDALADAARVSCRARRVDLELFKPSEWEWSSLLQTMLSEHPAAPPEHPHAPDDMIDDTLAQLFPQNHQVHLELIASEPAHAPAASRGHSVVFKAKPDSLQSVVVKLAIGERIEDEFKNYEQYVKGQLGGQFNARLEHHTTFWDLGGAVYNFLSSKLQAIDTFAHFYSSRADAQTIIRPLKHFFDEVWSDYYSQPLSGFENDLLFDAYNQQLKLADRMSKFPNREKQRRFTGLGIELPNLIVWTEEHREASRLPKAHFAITHGDLHADNLFVDGEHTWAIDFERTGPSHALRDFAELEIDLLTRLVPENVDVQTFFVLATDLVAPLTPSQPIKLRKRAQAHAEAEKAFRVIKELRKIASRKIGAHDMREYLWGLLLDALFVATLPEDTADASKTRQRERALLFGGIICERLEHWNSEWPPKTWRIQLAKSQSPQTTPRRRKAASSAPNARQVFLSYNRRDKDLVSELATRLGKAGIPYWMDTRDLQLGLPWRDEVEQGLRRCKVCIVCISRRGLGPVQKREVGVAQDRQVREPNFRVIPLLLPGSVPEAIPAFLAQGTWIDLRGGLADKKEISRLVRTLRPRKKSRASQKRRRQRR